MFEIEGMLYDFCVENFSYISMMSYLVFFFSQIYDVAPYASIPRAI
jgi:hypothetical protein